MSMMPEDRARRWQSVFRRYGIPQEIEPDERETKHKKDTTPNPLPRASEALLPDLLRRREPKRPEKG